MKVTRRKGATEEPYQQILSRLAHIEHKVDSIDETNAFALRADENRHFETVKKIFRKGRRRAQVYLAANGNRAVEEIALARIREVEDIVCIDADLADHRALRLEIGEGGQRALRKHRACAGEQGEEEKKRHPRGALCKAPGPRKKRGRGR